MSNKNRTYTPEFKQEALDRPAAAIERELGITTGLLSRWYRRQQKQRGQINDGEEASEEKRRIRELERWRAVLLGALASVYGKEDGGEKVGFLSGRFGYVVRVSRGDGERPLQFNKVYKE